MSAQLAARAEADVRPEICRNASILSARCCASGAVLPLHEVANEAEAATDVPPAAPERAFIRRSVNLRDAYQTASSRKAPLGEQ